MILKEVAKFKLRIRGRYQIQLPYTAEVESRGRNLNLEVWADSLGIHIGNQTYNVFGIEIQSRKDAAIYVNSRPYRGRIRILSEGNFLSVVNIVSLEDYLKGVLEYEVAHWWPMEALKAQAVASRTYALYMKKINKDKSYDLTSDVFTQIYGGKLGERWRVKRAIRHTQGLVLFYNAEILPAFYHSTCAGNTDDASHLWKLDLPPLRGVKCDFCRYSPHYRWQKRISLQELVRKFEQAGYHWTSLDSISIKELYPTGYVKSVQVIADGKEHLISGKELREILGNDFLRSRKFVLKKIGSHIQVKGYGWGHGIGLCQWGAYGMARKGYNFKEILRHYYPGAEIKKVIWDGTQD